MPPRSEARSPLGALPPDRRAAVELVLRRGRSYAELGELLGIPSETVRDRARSAVEALAPDLPPPSESGAIADWLLGRQDADVAARTRAAVAADPAAREWATTVAGPLRAVGGQRVPEIPPAAPSVAEALPARRSSRLGGAVLLGALGLGVAAVLAFVLTRGGDDTPAPAGASATPTATASATGTDDILLRGPAGSEAAAVMRLLPSRDGTVSFALAAEGLPANGRRDSYAIWFTRSGLPPRRLGFAQTRVGKDGKLTTGGPLQRDLKRFPRWFATYDAVLLTRETRPDAKRPGAVVLRGALPHASR